MLDGLLKERLVAAAWWSLVVLALVALLVLLRITRAGNRWIVRLTSVALGVSTGVMLSYVDPSFPSAFLLFAWLTALCCLAVSTLLAGERFAARPMLKVEPAPPATGLYVVGVVGLFAGTVSGACVLFVLLQRLLELASVLLTIRPWSGDLSGYGLEGVWVLSILLAGAVLAGWATRDARLLLAVFALTWVLAAWVCLLEPVLTITPRGIVRYSGRSVALAGVMGVIVGGFGYLYSWWRTRQVSMVTGEHPMPPPDITGRRRQLAGQIVSPVFRALLVAAGLSLILLAWYHVVVAFDSAGLPRPLLFLALAGSACFASAGCWAASDRDDWSGTADTAFALLTTAAACLGVAFLPELPETMAERYPWVFNALLVAMTFAAGIWTGMAEYGERRRDLTSARTPSPERWIGAARRYAFVCVILALTAGGMMSFWPRLPAIATPDFTLARITAGFGGHLLLLLVALWMARRIRTPAFTLLVPLVLLAAAGFMLLRMLPYTPRFG
ncbi:MAG: hypothetical protein J5J06_00835 [Phycisphaerae bacterium]|nr:hypothetical protein [Phycisphaerae bacterium]